MARTVNETRYTPDFDIWLLLVTVALMGLGLVMVASTSMSIGELKYHDPFYFVVRQALYIVLSVALASFAVRIPLKYWRMAALPLLGAGILLLALVLVPSIGREVNGSTRWISFGIMNVQASEVMKFSIIIYLAAYLAEFGEKIEASLGVVVWPVILVMVCALLLLAEPDVGATVVIAAIVLGMMFLAGLRFLHFFVLAALAALAVFTVAQVSAEHWARLTTFLDPWAKAFDEGFQLTQALIAFGRGEWLGVGLGEGIQKLFYLPEAHTDFLFAMLAEELGLVASLLVIALFLFVVGRALLIGHRAAVAGLQFGAYLAYGLGLLIGLQALVNIGVNMGVLPTKGLTLPLMSYGGSSLVITTV
ncbi:MAG: putative lipid II flippase FtsW, partial [Gammaproteobacteria bacterium]|nr:putative lipid II flippase FtsW [Gammaproteobacteria bacterium]